MIRGALALALVALVAASSAADPLSFVVMGDWGGQDTSPYTTAGEVATAKMMATTISRTNAKFALALGDNFYTYGVKNEFDSRFENTFEKPFAAPEFQAPFTFHVLSGNHDHYGNASGEVAYTQHSNRWHYPSFFYNFTEVGPDGTTVEFVMIDTVLLAGNSLTDNGRRSLPGSELPGADDGDIADAQLVWIEKTLAASTADYLVVSGHYPVYSICEHGPTSLLIAMLKPLLEKYNATGYWAGHDHCAEFLQYNGMDYHGIGAAHGCDSSTAHKDKVPSGSLKFHWADGAGAFALVNATKSGMTVQHIADSGEILFTAPPRAPRRQL